MRFLLAAAFAMSVAVPLKADDVVAKDSYGITVAVMQGNAPELERIGKTGTPARLAGRAGYYRVRGDIAQSNKWADTCIADPGVSGGKTQGLMYLCRSLRAGNRLLEGDVAGWARDMQQVRALYKEKIAPSLGPGEEVSPITVPAFERFIAWPESGTLRAPVAVGTRLPVLAVSEKAGVPVIHGKIRGGRDGIGRNVESDFILDTGATRSHVSRKAAQAMGLKVTDGFGIDTTDPKRPILIGLTDPVDVEFDGIKFKDVSFAVIDTVDSIVIGLDLLRRLGPFVLGADRLQTLDALPANTCKEPLATTSSLWGGQYGLRLPMRIGKRDELVALDTGSDVPLEASGMVLTGYPQKALVERQKLTMYGVTQVRYAEATAPVTFNGTTATLKTLVSDQPGMVFPISWRVGFGLRNDYDYYVDVAKGRGCLSPKSPR